MEQEKGRMQFMIFDSMRGGRMMGNRMSRMQRQTTTHALSALFCIRRNRSQNALVSCSGSGCCLNTHKKKTYLWSCRSFQLITWIWSLIERINISIFLHRCNSNSKKKLTHSIIMCIELVQNIYSIQSENQNIFNCVENLLLCMTIWVRKKMTIKCEKRRELSYWRLENMSA